MESKKAILIVAVPLAGAALLAAALWMRPGVRSAKPEKRPTPTPQVRAAEPVYAPVRAEKAPPPAPPEKIAQATEIVRVRGTYQNYRRAVASNDADLQKTLLPVLLRDREAARKCVDEDLARAQTDMDRVVAGRVLEALRR